VLEWIGDDFDSAALTGSRPAKVLKMLASFFGSRNPRRTQLRFLRELRRVLKPGGQLFVAIENRWGYEYFTGRPDHHSGLLYGSLLPRFLANAYSIAWRRQPYRTYTYSRPGARRLFAQAGFAHQQFLGLTPGYSRLSEIVPVDSGPPLWSPPRKPDARERVKRSRYFVPAFGIIAGERPCAGSSLLERLLERLRGQLETSETFRFYNCIVSGREKIILDGWLGGRGVVLKIPVEASALRGETTNASMLKEILDDARFGPYSAKPLAQGSFQKLAYFLESKVAGVPLSTCLTAANRAEMAGQMARLLSRCASSAAAAMIHTADEPYRSLVAEPVAKLSKVSVDPCLLGRIEAHCREGLTKTPWRLGVQHGDLSTSNVFVADGVISGIIDWEHGMPSGLPALDALAYMESAQRRIHGRSACDNLKRLARWDWDCEDELDMLRAVYRALNVDPASHPLLCRLLWLRSAGFRLDESDRFDPGLPHRWVDPMAGEFEERSRNLRAPMTA
jgi:hypothetical protein